MKNKLFIITIFLTLLGNASNAENFNYDYIEFKVGTTNSDATEKEIYAVASKSINENISFRGGLYYFTGDWNLTGKYKEQSSLNITAEAIFHQELRTNTDILLSVGYSNSDYKSTCVTTAAHYICSASTTRLNNHEYYGVSLGIRQRLSDSIEAELYYAGVKANNSPTINQVHLSLMKELTSKLSIGANYRWNTNLNDFNQSEVVLRRQF